MSHFLTAVQLIEDRGWHRGAGGGPDGSLCALDACAVARGDDPLDVDPDDYGLLAIAANAPDGDAGLWNDVLCGSKEDACLALMGAHELWAGRVGLGAAS